MKAVSLWNPWASAIGRGKSNETRGWFTNYTGPLAIHAAKIWNAELAGLLVDEPFLTALGDVFNFVQPLPLTHEEKQDLIGAIYGRDPEDYLPFGAVGGVVNQVACLPAAIVKVYQPCGIETAPRPDNHFNRIAGTPTRFMDRQGIVWIDETERAFGDYSDGRFIHIYSNIRLLPKPIPCRGAQGFFNIDLAELDEFWRTHKDRALPATPDHDPREGRAPSGHPLEMTTPTAQRFPR